MVMNISSGISNMSSQLEGTATQRSRIKNKFLDIEREEIYKYIQDLESTLSINKELVQELCESPSDYDSKKLICKLNKENAKLQQDFIYMKKNRDNAHCKLLITQQIVEDLKGKEHELTVEFSENVTELKDQLGRKEFVLQSMEKRFLEAEKLLQKYSKDDKDIRSKLRELRINIGEERTITSVVEDNSKMKVEITGLVQKIEDLEIENEKVLQRCEDIRNKYKETKAQNKILQTTQTQNPQININFQELPRRNPTGTTGGGNQRKSELIHDRLLWYLRIFSERISILDHELTNNPQRTYNAGELLTTYKSIFQINKKLLNSGFDNRPSAAFKKGVVAEPILSIGAPKPLTQQLKSALSLNLPGGGIPPDKTTQKYANPFIGGGDKLVEGGFDAGYGAKDFEDLLDMSFTSAIFEGEDSIIRDNLSFCMDKDAPTPVKLRNPNPLDADQMEEPEHKNENIENEQDLSSDDEKHVNISVKEIELN